MIVLNIDIWRGKELKRGNPIIDEVWQRVKVDTMYVVVWIRHTEAVFLDFVHNKIDEMWGVKVDTTYAMKCDNGWKSIRCMLWSESMGCWFASREKKSSIVQSLAFLKYKDFVWTYYLVLNPLANDVD